MGLAAVAGPLLGGGLVNLDLLGTGWRAIFLVNVPLGLAALVAGRALPAARRAVRARARGSTCPACCWRWAAGVARRVPADPGPRARLAGLVLSRCWPAASVLLGAFARAAAPPLAPRPDAAGRAVDPAPPPLRRRPGGRARLHRRDGRDDDRAERHVPGGPGLLAAGQRRGHRRDAAGGDRRIDHLVGAAGPDRARRRCTSGSSTMAGGLVVVRRGACARPAGR